MSGTGATLPSYTVRSLVNYLDANGLSRVNMLNQLGCDEDFLNDPEKHFAAQQYEALLNTASKDFGLSNIGFRFGQAFELSVWGLLGFIVAAAPDLRQALVLQKRYQCLLGNSGLAYHETQQDVTTMRWLSECCHSAHSTEQVITAWLAFAFQYTQSAATPLSVHFTHEALVAPEEYQAFFRCPVHFNAEFNGIRVKTDLLMLPLRTSNSEVLNVLCCHAEQRLQQKRKNASLDIVRQYIIEVLPDHVPDLPEIANYLELSPRQLQRQFQRAGTSLTQFMESIRLSLAVSYLTQTDHKLLYIAQILGYSEQSAFQRAFKRHFAVTPGEYRLNPVALSASAAK